MEENDEDAQVWYLTALCHFKMGEEHWSAAKYHFQRARQLAEFGEEDPDTLMEMDNYLEQLTEIEMEEDMPVNDNDDDHWSTEDEDDDKHA